MHLLKLRVGQWTFTPGLWPTLAAIFFFVLTVWLGNWQSERAESKRAVQARFDQAEKQAAIHVGHTLLDRESVLHRRVEVDGVFDDAQTILLDNRVYNGVAGYHILTPLSVTGGRYAVLVNRGWVATGRSRDQLPVVPVPPGQLHLEGMAVDPHSRYVELASSEPASRVWQNLDFARFERQYGAPLQPFILLQTSDTGDGLVRDWPRPDSGVSMHTSYAFQWYSLATTLVVLWLVLNVKRHRHDDQ
ncbi:MAG TPA: SURF1 family protein [Thiobacillus sp.]